MDKSDIQETLGIDSLTSFILGMITCVSLDHTECPLNLLHLDAFINLQLAQPQKCVFLVAINWIELQRGLMISTSAWTIIFGLFTVLYRSIFVGPRI